MIEPLALIAAFIAGASLGPWWLGYQKRKGVVSLDVYKGRPNVPKAGGLIALVAGLVGLSALSTADLKLALAIPVIFVIGLVGLLDDLFDLNEYVRVAVPLLAAVALYFLVRLKMTLPFMGTFYSPAWLAVLAIPVVTNAYNMLDPVNGFLPLSNALIGASLAISAYLRGEITAAYAFGVHVAASLALYLYNRYPAKAFNGNVGSYFLGAEASVLAAVYNMVPQLVFASMPYIVNGILIVFSARGIKGRGKIDRPTYLSEGRVNQNCDSSVLSLVRLLVADGPLDEYSIFKGLTILTLITSALSIAI
ncbi:MAG: UDP-N-acetylglucosamine--dolichyl-phosphate N-acetylglucosaminephosphotransferase [Thermoproteus sp. AZ2]|jgi:UDP-N-acetylglucosamine--dolichyl-phosphate N-acetylglucosaminephosphotransferase|uniref:UDP-N-acetylglucosamine--dolichyl-phosphate N-acetylglucosaminephosphotransferase n=1 Tax=Thermoproteus sp. AZ2 TaxID=1609232 RepID=A0ACC6UYY2_9CREN|nr:MAG: UDP-N-acetylglucosamine--dolichyl-phosphate N-acetylglucosaminephosphotransferase [Thermoproteus sp. AZ2]